MSWIDDIREIKKLLDDGVISPEEFEAEKNKLLIKKDKESDSGFSSRPNPDAQIGAYRLLGTIGSGGMGEVYRAIHRNEAKAKQQGGPVAIKVMHQQYSQNPDFRERFDREASLGLKLSHPGIVRVFDLVEDNNRLAIVMELVEGVPLSDKIGTETGPIPYEKAYPLFDRILTAVGYAHENGVVHRDIKPENVMVLPDGEIKILDFGIAKDAASSRTKTGMGMGTVNYMAPEQYLNAKAVDHRSDIYALGMTLYEMLAGRLPWDTQETEFTILKKKEIGEIPPPSRFYPYIPPQVEEVVARATSVVIADRYASVAEFREGFASASKVAPPVQATAQAKPIQHKEVRKAPVDEPHPTPSSGSLETVAGGNGFWKLFALTIVVILGFAVWKMGDDSKSV